MSSCPPARLAPRRACKPSFFTARFEAAAKGHISAVRLPRDGPCLLAALNGMSDLAHGHGVCARAVGEGCRRSVAVGAGYAILVGGVAMLPRGRGRTLPI